MITKIDFVIQGVKSRNLLNGCTDNFWKRSLRASTNTKQHINSLKSSVEDHLAICIIRLNHCNGEGKDNHALLKAINLSHANSDRLAWIL